MLPELKQGSKGNGITDIHPSESNSIKGINVNTLFLLIDFGSTFTKVAAVDIEKVELIGKAQSPSTVNTNMLYGLQNSLDKLIDNNNVLNKEIIFKTHTPEEFLKKALTLI